MLLIFTIAVETGYIYLSIYLSAQLGISAIMNDKIPIHWNGEGDVDLKLLCNTIAKTPIIMSDE